MDLKRKFVYSWVSLPSVIQMEILSELELRSFDENQEDHVYFQRAVDQGKLTKFMTRVFQELKKLRE